MQHRIVFGQNISCCFSGLLLIVFLCNDMFYALFFRIAGPTFSNGLYIIAFFVLLYLAILEKGSLALAIPLLIYLIVFLAIFVTSAIHPEYDEWFSHSVYGIIPAFINPRCGIWALLVFWLAKDNDKLLSYINVAVWILFIYYMLQFYAAARRGYWVSYRVDGTLVHGRYNLEYGYNLLFPISFFGANAYLKNKKIYYIPFAISFVMVLIRGSRGAIIWPVFMFLFMLPLKWKLLSQRKQIGFVILFFLAADIFFIIYLYYDLILSGLSVLFTQFGFSSRTLESLLQGSFVEGNGREQIYEMAMNQIKKGGAFGWGVYGDRYVIGEYFMWGYSHNLFLELLVSFGYVGGGLLILLYFLGIVKLFRSDYGMDKKILFVTFFTASMKLMLSNSFWYTDAFWIVLAMMIGWKANTKKKDQNDINGNAARHAENGCTHHAPV